MRIFSIIRRKCTICGEKCDNIGDKTSQGFIKEWCDKCTLKRIGTTSYCERCL